MKIKCDDNGFIWEMFPDDYQPQDMQGYTFFEVSYPFGNIVDPVFAIPLYQYVEGSVVQITDPQVYMIDPDIWLSYLDKLNSEVQFLLRTKTDSELKTIYETSPDYVKTAIYQGIELKWADTISQHRLNLTLEMAVRVLCEHKYIVEVEQREPNAEERAGIDQFLALVHNHSATVEFPIKSDAWYHQFISSVLEDSDYARYSCIPQRLFITGRT